MTAPPFPAVTRDVLALVESAVKNAIRADGLRQIERDAERVSKQPASRWRCFTTRLPKHAAARSGSAPANAVTQPCADSRFSAGYKSGRSPATLLRSSVAVLRACFVARKLACLHGFPSTQPRSALATRRYAAARLPGSQQPQLGGSFATPLRSSVAVPQARFVPTQPRSPAARQPRHYAAVRDSRFSAATSWADRQLRCYAAPSLRREHACRKEARLLATATQLRRRAASMLCGREACQRRRFPRTQQRSRVARYPRRYASRAPTRGSQQPRLGRSPATLLRSSVAALQACFAVGKLASGAASHARSSAVE
jgi:hypothetical protein